MKRLLPIRIMMSGLLLTLVSVTAQAQLSSNPDKFLGNITTRYNVDYGNEKYYTLWNQITCENESKWGSVEGTRGSFNWGCDNAVNYAKQHNFPFKFHALIWGAQYPNWLPNLSPSERYQAIIKWLDAIKKKYPKLDMIDVVNEAVGMHQQGNPMMKESLGGEGVTGYDWLIKAFELAYERWPDAILIYNDYNTFQWDTDNYIKLVQTLRNAGAPIDAYGCQSHDVTDISLSNFKSVMAKIQNALKMPMYSTEFDVGTTDDNKQLTQYKNLIPVMWEADYCAGITLWGYIYGATWTTDGNSGIIRDGKDRPAMTWLREYMKTDKAKNAKSPYPGMKKEASLYVKAAGWNVARNDSIPITVRLQMRTKTVDHVDLYVKNKLYATMYEEPYVAYYKPTTQGTYDLKAIVTTTDSCTYERLASFNTLSNTRSPYNKDMELPGVIEAEDFDIGADGLTYHDSDTRNDGVRTYRTNGGGIDLLKVDTAYVVGHTVAGEWMEYTVNVTEEGYYNFDAIVSAGAFNASFQLALSNYDMQTDLTNVIPVPCYELGDWDTFTTVHGRMLVPLKTGKQKIRLNITGGQCHIDKIAFSRVDINENMKVTVRVSPTSTTVGNKVTVRVTTTYTDGTIAAVRVYDNGELIQTCTEAPYDIEFYPEYRGSHIISAIAVDEAGKESKEATATVTAKSKRVPFKEMNVPGIIEAEDFDKGGEGLTFHDSDEKDEGGYKYRLDNEGIDILSGNKGYVVGKTAEKEWMDYSVNVAETAKFSFKATVGSAVEGSKFTISMVRGTTAYTLASVTVPKTSSSTYKEVEGTFQRSLAAGSNIIRITITGAQCNIDKLEIIGPDTAINGIENDEATNRQIYNLSGQRQQNLQRGINIVDGKKVLVR
ncbi:MAG: endo-1,4-beta-xylanase [Bacteroidaceae bacterium]|nr:endo-1,4-beta-xylanase [Bacteroidaceae bacterium]